MRAGGWLVRACVLVLAAVLLLAPSSATAQTFPVLRTQAGYGFGDAYGAGFGGSAGVEIPFFRDRRFFVGLRAMYHLGSDGLLEDFAEDGESAPSGSVSQFQTGIEIGATWMASPVFIRTVGGIGMARVDLDLDSGSSELAGVNTKLQYGPGLLLALPMDEGRFAGLEIRWLKVSDLESALALYGTFGVRLF